MKITNKHQLPRTLVNIVARDSYSRGRAHVSVTRLIDSPQMAILREKNDAEITVDVSEMVWSFLGRILHKILEYGGDEEHVPEERLFLNIGGWRISGQIDVQHIGDEVDLFDYKLTRAWAVQAEKQEWVNQLNVYAFLVRRVLGYRVGKIRVCAFIRDWSKYEAESKPDYPKSAITLVEAPLWTEKEQETYVLERLALHQAAQVADMTGDPLPPCSDSERWKRDGTWAAWRTGNKRPTRVFDNGDEALEFVKDKKDYFIKTTPPTFIRCKDYCAARPWCKQAEKDE